MSATNNLPLAIPPRDRFVRAIADKLDPERIVEMHLFQPMRNAGVETGVAVIAANLPVDDSSAETSVVSGTEGSETHAARSTQHAAENLRKTVFTAWYKLTLKGPERGKWEFNFADEAVAPLATIVAVARGVGERAGDAEDPERWTGEHFRTALSEAAAG